MITDYTEYLTTDGDRPDLLAYRFYGSQYNYAQICNANPAILGLPILPGGLVLKIPVVTQTATIAPDLLPPWKR